MDDIIWLEELRSTRPCGQGGVCDHKGDAVKLCEQCERYAGILRSAREVYSTGKWLVGPDGILQEVA